LYFQAKDKHGISALLAAIWEGHTDCVKLLLEQVSPQKQQYSVPELLLQLLFWMFTVLGTAVLKLVFPHLNINGRVYSNKQ